MCHIAHLKPVPINQHNYIVKSIYDYTIRLNKWKKHNFLLENELVFYF